MRAVSAAFLAAVVAGFDLAFRADVLLEGTTIAEEVPVSGGQLTLDRRRLIRGVSEITVPGYEWVPTTAFDPLAPFGQELALYAGIAHRDGLGDELVGLGIYRVDESNSEESDSGAVTTVTGGDRSAAVSDAGFIEPWEIADGTNVGTAVEALVADALPWVEFRFAETAFTLPPLVFPETDDRWARAVELAASAGMELFFDGLGVCVMQPEPSLLADPVGEIVEGETGTLISAARRWSRVGRPNAVVATGSNSATGAFRGVAYDLDPGSPTVWDGPYGRVVEHISGPYTSTEMATVAAVARLQSQIGVVQSVDVEAVPNFALEPSDVIAARRTLLGVDETDIIDALTFGLSAEARMRGTMRARQALVLS